MTTAPGKPVFALMGEFSAGKSTLANLLIGSCVSPVKVTATELPPVWFRHGTGNPVVVDLDGNETRIAMEDLSTVPVATTAFVRVYVEAELLEIIDLIDMPGNSDPNMSADVWRRALHHANGVIWCSHATQAWRQSEAAVWEELPETLHPTSILLLTRFDKIKGEVDRARVLRRVRAEADGLFRAILPISLLNASAAENREEWEASGAEAFLQVLLDLAMGAAAQPEPEPVAATGGVMPRRVAVPERERASARPGS
jgi:GTPase Era involved in 16S rRNA processing